MARRHGSSIDSEDFLKFMKNAATTAAFILLCTLIWKFFLGTDAGIIKYSDLVNQKQELTIEITTLERSNKEMSDKLKSLGTSTDTIESLAREQGLVKQGEIVYQYEDKK